MKQITAEEFKAEIAKNPAWASTLTRPLEIVGFCNMADSKITHLSPLLYFTDPDRNGKSAEFTRCEALKTAEGNFDGFVSFAVSGVEKIGKLRINRPNVAGYAASFTQCTNLKVAEGTFPGFVGFIKSGIEKIGELTITHPDQDGVSSNFSGCANLKTIPAKYLTLDYEMEEAVRRKNLAGIAVKRAQRKEPDIEI